jgi:hypothetical protein
MEAKNYSQHLLRMKTTSSLTTGAAGGHVNTGHHVLNVYTNEIEQGIAPSEQFIALRNPTGSREFIELCARRGAGPPPAGASRADGPVQLSQAFPRQTVLSHHVLHFDTAPTVGERSAVFIRCL